MGPRYCYIITFSHYTPGHLPVKARGLCGKACPSPLSRHAAMGDGRADRGGAVHIPRGARRGIVSRHASSDMRPLACVLPHAAIAHKACAKTHRDPAGNNKAAVFSPAVVNMRSLWGEVAKTPSGTSMVAARCRGHHLQTAFHMTFAIGVPCKQSAGLGRFRDIRSGPTNRT